MTDDPKLRDTALLADIDKRLALLEQAQRVESGAREQRDKGFQVQLTGIGNRLDHTLDLWQTVTSDPAASAAGRAIGVRLSTVEVTVDEHEDFIRQAEGAMKLARWALGTSLVSLVATIVAILAALGFLQGGR